MADIVCTRCGASWDVDYSAEDSAENFEFEGGLIYGCSECTKVKPKHGRKEQALRGDGTESGKSKESAGAGPRTSEPEALTDDEDATKLLTPAIRERLPKLYATEHDKDPMVQVKFFSPWMNWTWYVTEFDGEDICFGLVEGFATEWGYFSLSEIQAGRGPLGVPVVERDLHFRATPISAVTKGKSDE